MDFLAFPKQRFCRSIWLCKLISSFSNIALQQKGGILVFLCMINGSHRTFFEFSFVPFRSVVWGSVVLQINLTPSGNCFLIGREKILKLFCSRLSVNTFREQIKSYSKRFENLKGKNMNTRFNTGWIGSFLVNN